MKTTRFPEIDVTTPAAVQAKIHLMQLGVETWVHDKIYALVRDPQAPQGYRLAASADSYPALLDLVNRMIREETLFTR